MLKADFSVLAPLDLSMYDTVDFVINTGSCSFVFELPNIVGRLMSPKFNSLFESDQNILQFIVPLDGNILRKCQDVYGNNQNEEEFLRRAFNKMIEAYKGLEVEVTFGECELIREISKSIGSNVVMTAPNVEINEDNFRHILNAFGTKGSIEYAAENIERINEDEVNRISPEMFEKVLKSEKLKVRSENALLEIVSKFIESNGGECIGLLSLIEIKFLGMRERIKYIGLIRRWAERNFLDQEFMKILDSFESFIKGMIFTNRRIFIEDVTSELGIDVDITASSECDANNPRINLEGFRKQNDAFECLVTNNFKDSWIQWDFHNDVSIHSYEIECDKASQNSLLRNWRIDVSNNGTNWETVDERHNQTQLTKGTKTKYTIKTPEYARYIRLTQVGKNSSDSYNLLIRNMKFRGALKSINYQK